MPEFNAALGQLPGVLDDDEIPEKLRFAEYRDSHQPVARHGVLAATERRLAFVTADPCYTEEVHQFLYSDIDRVDYAKGLISEDLKVWVLGREEIFNLDRWSVEDWTTYLNGKTAQEVSDGNQGRASRDTANAPEGIGRLRCAFRLRLGGMVATIPAASSHRLKALLA